MTEGELSRLVAVLVGAYFLGSIPVAWLLARWHLGRDIRTMGSGNVGVLNTALSVHRWAGLLVFLGEIAKGALAVIVARVLLQSDVAVALAALGVFVGTRWPVWLRFHGGRGNTVAATSLALISPVAVLLLAGLWIVARKASGSNFVATRLGLAILPVALGLFTGSWLWAGVGAAYALLFVTTHRTETDDHLLLKEEYAGVAAFLTSPPRHRHT
jgi:acyl phosphate:glycerol-3-phosphate acyltransferase